MQPARPRSKSKATGWPSPSHVAVFIRNLKLLQLDQLDDWPDISTRALSSSQQNQRLRIKCVEWALYRLFAIWDPEGTQNVGNPPYPNILDSAERPARNSVRSSPHWNRSSR